MCERLACIFIWIAAVINVTVCRLRVADGQVDIDRLSEWERL